MRKHRKTKAEWVGECRTEHAYVISTWAAYAGSTDPIVAELYNAAIARADAFYIARIATPMHVRETCEEADRADARLCTANHLWSREVKGKVAMENAKMMGFLVDWDPETSYRGGRA